MHGLIGTRLLNRFLGSIRQSAETDAMNETGLPENYGKSTERPKRLRENETLSRMKRTERSRVQFNCLEHVEYTP
jgi:hypothetical protein